MAENCSASPSVAELAGKFKGSALPTPARRDGFPKKPMRQPPNTLNLQKKDPESEGPQKPTGGMSPQAKGRLKNSPLFEKIQANLALSPTAAPPTSGSFLSPPLSPTQKPSVDEVPVSFEKPVEGTPLLSINKCRARLSFKRRPPTRQHRKSGSDEPGSPSEQNGGRNDVFDGDAPPASTVKESSQEGQGEERGAENPEAKPPRPDAAHGEDVSEDKPATEEAGRPTEDTATDVQQGHPPGADGATEGKGEETTPPPEEEEETKEKLSAGQ